MGGAGAVLVAAACAAGLAAGLVLLVAAVRGTERSAARPDGRAERFMSRLRSPRMRRWFAAGAGTAVVVAVLTRWPVAAAAAGVLVVTAPYLFSGRAVELARIQQIEALATWTESLKDTIAGAAYGLEQVIPATIRTAPAELVAPLNRMIGLLHAQVPLPAALRRFAAEIADPVADTVVAALLLTAEMRGPTLRDTLTELARNTRAQVDARRRIDARRRSIHRNSIIIMIVTLVLAVGLAVFSRDFLRPYESVAGQLVLLVVVAMFGAGFLFLRRLAEFPPTPRVLPREDGERR